MLVVFGVSWGWPLGAAVTLLQPVADALGSVGIAANRELSWLCLFLAPSLLVVGSLLPGI